MLPNVTRCYQLFSELVTGRTLIKSKKKAQCYQCYQLFHRGLLKYRVIEENNRHMIIYFFYNSIIRRSPRAHARSARGDRIIINQLLDLEVHARTRVAREIKIYILII